MKGEEAIRGALDNHWILRSSWIYGLRGSRFFNSILSKAINSESIKVVEDQFGQPTSTLMIYETIHRIISGELETGTHHVVPVKYVSRYEFSLAINKAYKEVYNTDRGSQIDPILTHQTMGVAPRSPYSLLQPSQSALGINSLNLHLVDEIIRIIKLRKAGTL
jgi:dTDP-4-dehydrorhamnose reductase